MDNTQKHSGHSNVHPTIRKKKASRWLKLRKSEDGAASIEFALVSIPFFLVMFGIIEQGMYFLVHRLIDAGAYQIAREVKTGDIRGGANGNFSEAQFKQRLCGKVVMKIFDCAKVVVDVRQIGQWDNPTSPDTLPDGSIDPSAVGFSPGGRSTVNVVRVYYDWPTVLDWEKYGAGITGHANIDSMGTDGHRRIVGTAAFMTEPF